MSRSRTIKADTPLPGLSAIDPCRGMLTANLLSCLKGIKIAGLRANSPGLETLWGSPRLRLIGLASSKAGPIVVLARLRPLLALVEVQLRLDVGGLQLIDRVEASSQTEDGTQVAGIVDLVHVAPVDDLLTQRCLQAQPR